MKEKRGAAWLDVDDDVVNKRAEYEVQATNGTEHDFPQIAQGMAKETKQALTEKKERWYHQRRPD